MVVKDFVWLASYPRSGNTFLRIVLHHAFGLKSASVYPNDLGGKKALEEFAGHVEHGPDLQARLKQCGLPLIKTHELPNDQRPAIYIVRDGRAACVSLWEFFERKVPIETIIAGQHRFGTWADHVKAWTPWDRPDTLFLQYENLRDDLPGTLDTLSHFLQRDILSRTIPSRETVANSDGEWVRKPTSWRTILSDQNLATFVEINRCMLEKTGYL